MKKPKGVLLINPGERSRIFQQLSNDFVSLEPPAWVGLFAMYLEKKGVPVEVYDASLLGSTPAETADIALSFNPALVVLVVYGAQPSASTQHMTSAGKIATAIRASDGPLVMMVGTHPSALPYQTMEEEDVDFVCDLEGPETIFKLHQALMDGEKEDFSKIPSLWWRARGGEIRAPFSAQPLIHDLDSTMPGIAWRHFPVKSYRSHNWHSFDHINERSPYAAIHTSLGCVFRCHFCCINSPFGKPAYRMWSPETVVKEIDFLVCQHGVKNIKFIDEMFVLNRHHVIDICRLLALREYEVNIWAYARVDTVHDELLPWLKAAGVNWLCLGIESASKHVRDGALKKYGNEEIINTVRRIQAHGIYVIGNYIFGLPDDTKERMQETLDLALELNCEYANFYSAMAYPGSPLYKQAVEEGRQLPEKWEDYSQHGYGTLPLANDYCTSAEILKFRDEAFKTYFTNGNYLAMIKRKFGHKVVHHIGQMVQVPLRRKILGDPPYGSPSP